MMSHEPQHVGAPDPERKTSAIIEQRDEEIDVAGQEDADAGCVFNDRSFAHGVYVCSGSELLRCERGVWVRAGGCDPDNP